MKAIVQREYGTDPDVVLQVAEVERPAVGEDEVLVRVRAASVDRGTWHVMTGRQYLIRAVGFGLPRAEGSKPGAESAGAIEAVGRGVTEFAPGDDVYGSCDGSFAELARVKLGMLAAKPANLSFEQAATVPVSAGRGSSSRARLRQSAGVRCADARQRGTKWIDERRPCGRQPACQ